MSKRLAKTLLMILVAPFLSILCMSLALLVLVLPVAVFIDPKILSLPEEKEIK